MIYLPCTANILTRGHIECLEFLCKKDFVIVGLLTKKGLRGYKKELVSWEDRKYILEHLDIYGYTVVPQDSLDPTENIIGYECDTIASGDGWEKQEKKCIKKLGLKVINIRLQGEKKKKYSSSRILKRVST